MRPGDVYALNDPYHGGTHLPDVTVVTPVFDDGGAGRSCSTSRRAAITPRSAGSRRGRCLPSAPGSRRKGVLIDNWLLVRDGVLREAETLDLLRLAPYPSRNPQVNLADLRAQIAANERGAAELRRMCEHFGLDVVTRLHGSCAGQRRGGRPRRDRRAARRRVQLRARQRGRDQGRGPGRPGRAQRGDRLHRHLGPLCAATSTRRRRWRWRPCSTCCARWWPTRSRSTPAASSRSG